MRNLWNNRLVRWAAPVAWMGLIYFFSAQSKLPSLTPGLPDVQEIGGHFVMYFVLALLWRRALRAEGVRSAALWAWAITVLYGVTDEFHQGFVPGRQPSISDLAVDALAATVAVTIAHWWEDRGGKRLFFSAPSPERPARRTES